MNVLYLAHRIPYPPDKGDKIRSFHQVRHLGERHRVSLVCFADDRDDLRHVPALRRWCASVDVAYRSARSARVRSVRALLDGGPLSVAAFEDGALRRAAEARAAEADAVIAFSSVMAPYAPAGGGVPRLMDFVDVDSDKWRLYAERRGWPWSWIYAREAGRLGAFEASVAAAWDHSLLVSEREARILRARAPGRPVTVLPNGVDIDYFRPGAESGADGAPTRTREPPPLSRDRRPFEIVFTGMMDYFPNVDGVVHFCDSILPLIQRCVPGARFTIVGRNPARAVRRLASRPGVVVTGAVPDVRPYLARADVAVAPLRLARGLQNKVLEAMAMGLPVVGTAAAVDGLGAVDGAGLEVVDEPEAFAARVTDLLRDPDRRREAGRRARAHVERRHRWSDHGAALERILARLVRGPAAEAG